MLSIVKWLVNDKFDNNSEGCDDGLIQKISRNLPEGTDENQEKPKSYSQHPCRDVNQACSGYSSSL
jgi:hypothetical protein